jgi:methionyl-tRNA formyltransferase
MMSSKYYSADPASFYGPAPLHHTLLTGSTYTGVTVQTLHPKHFDRGTILLQHPSPGIKHNCRNVEDLSQSLGTKGGNMLVDCIRNRMYLYGSHVVPENTANEPRILGKHAPKITAADRFIDWTAWSGEEIRRRHEVIGPLWSLVKVDNDSQNLRRIIWSVGFESTFYRPDHELPVGQPIIIGYPSPSRVVYVRAYDGQVLTVRELKIEGGLQAQPFEAARKARINERETDQKDGPLFRGQLLSSLPDQYRNPEPSSQRTDHCDKTT